MVLLMHVHIQSKVFVCSHWILESNIRVSSNEPKQHSLYILLIRPIYIIMSMFPSFDPQRMSYLSRYQTEISDEKLSRFHHRIIQTDNKIDTEALQQYLNSIRASKIGNQRIITEKTQITYIISNVFTLLKRMLIIPQNQKSFTKIMGLYIELLKCRENSRHNFGLVEQHLKEVLRMDLNRKNKKLYEFVIKLFQMNPYTVYKILQSRHQLLDEKNESSLQIYQYFIEFAAMKKNTSLLLKEIKSCMDRQKKDLQRLKIVLKYYPGTPDPIVIKNIIQYIKELIAQLRYFSKQLQIRLLQVIKVFVALKWPQTQINKNQVILSYLKIWNNSTHSNVQSHLNDILENLQFDEQVLQQMRESIHIKIKQLSKGQLDQSQNFKAIRIILAKLQKQKCQQCFEEKEIQNIVGLAMDYQLKEQVVHMLDTIRNLNIFNMGDIIPNRVKDRIQTILGSEKKISSRPQSAGLRELPVVFTMEDKKLALRALRKLKLKATDVNGILRQHVLKKLNSQTDYEIRQQIIKNCLYLLRSRQLIDSEKVMREILNLINKDMKLKITTIEWFRDNEDRYSKKIFQIFKQPQYLHMLFQDYSSNQHVLKRFSIKVLCFIYPLNQCQIVPFLKRAYYHIYDRLESQKIVTLSQKKQALRLTRQILRHRTQIISEDAPSLCNFLYHHLYKAAKYEQSQKNDLLTQIFKTIIDLFRKTPRYIYQYAYCISQFIVKLLNSKDCDEKVKSFALASFNEIIRHCGYVIIPYFHFSNLFDIIREMLKQGSRGVDQIQLLRLMGNLGFINKDKYDRIRNLTVHLKKESEINDIFRKNYKQTWYTKQMMGEKEVTRAEGVWNGPYLFTQEQVAHTNIDLINFKQFILTRIVRVISEHPSRIINYMVFKVLQAIIPVITPVQTPAYQSIVIPEILKNSRESFNPGVFSLISRIVRCQDTDKYKSLIIDYLLSLTEIDYFPKTLQLISLLYILTGDSQGIIKDYRQHRLLSFITQHITKSSTSPQQIIIGFKIIENIADSLNNVIHLFLPQFNKIFLRQTQAICLCYFQTIITLCQKVPATEFYLPPITQSILELLKNQIQKPPTPSGNTFIQKIINFTIALILIFGDKFKAFILNLRTVLKGYNGKHVFYQIAEQYMKKHSTLNYLSQAFKDYEIKELYRSNIDVGVLKIEPQKIQIPMMSKKVISDIIDEFNCDKNEIEDESEEWFNKICLSLLEKSSQLFVHECLPLAKEERSFCHDIFPVAFYFFWKNLCAEGQKKITNKFKYILESKVISLTIKQRFLDTVYFMAQCKSPIPLKNKFLCEASREVLDLAKQLFYMQTLFENDPQTHGESLIKMYAELGQKQSAIGLLKIVQNLNTKTKILLNQKLKRYHDALKEYEHLEDSLKPQNMIMQITIRKQMSDWESVMKLCASQSSKNPLYRDQLAPLAVEASINLGKWDQVGTWIQMLDHKHQNLKLWKTMLKIHEKKYSEAERYINEDRKNIYTKTCQLFNFSFQRSMEGIIRLQQLCELQQAIHLLKHYRPSEEDKKYSQKEITNLLRNKSDPEEQRKGKYIYYQHKKRLQNLWNDRIQGSKKNMNSMSLLLLTRNLLLTKAEDLNNWLDFCHLALKQNHSQVSKRTLQLINQELKNDNDQKRKFQIENLMTETKFVLGQIKDIQAVDLVQKNIEQKGAGKSDQSICLLYFNCAHWLSEKQYDFNIEKANKCIDMLKKATQKKKDSVKGWHMMGLIHLKIDELLMAQKRKNGMQIEEIDGETKAIRSTHIFQALYCFIKSVSSGTKNHLYFLEDCLKIMNILFNQNEVTSLVDELNKNYKLIPSDGLIDIIPQIIGRLDMVEKDNIQDMMKKLLIHIGVNHPQAIVFYLVFLRKAKNDSRKKIADDIYREIIKGVGKSQAQEFQILYNQTELMVNQLCKVSLKLNEKFKILIGKVFEMSQKDRINNRIFAKKYLRICQKILNEQDGELSPSQFGFLQQYRQQIGDIVNLLHLFLQMNEPELFRRAERLIYRILGQLKMSLKEVKKIFLEETSPPLMKMKNTSVCIPGSYKPSSTQKILINSFKNELKVLISKQRPKKLIIEGSDGKQHVFLLKGKEDLRLDQRIMQLFNLINKMFRDPQERENYQIKGYSITPISLETGVIQWVQNCDTIGQLIMQHRDSTNIDKNLELKISASICEDYLKLPKAHKVQIYKQIEKRVSGNDLRNIFWIRSSNSEEWLKSRSCYTRSLAVMSMVGFIIGLGDRHPNNIMIQRNTGKVVHIDFGDCFDVNKMRIDYPQKVSFRLTRMLVKAMEPCGIHGIFTHTCEKIISMLRNNKESIIAIIEAFRYDPIIGWKLHGDEVKMLQNSFENNQTEESMFEQEQNDKAKEVKPNIEFAVHVLNEIKKKLGGKSAQDINKVMSPQQQVSALIKEAMSPQNLVQHYSGWAIYW